MEGRNSPRDVSDEQWELLRRLILPRARRGRKPLDRRAVLNVILYVLLTGCQWRAVKVIFADSAYCRSGLPDGTRQTCDWILQTILRPVGLKHFVRVPNAGSSNALSVGSPAGDASPEITNDFPKTAKP